MLKMKFWFEGNQLQPDCNIHGGCKIGSSACHACPHCVRVNSKDQEVLCLGDGSEYKEVKLEELRVWRQVQDSEERVRDSLYSKGNQGWENIG